MSLNEEQEKKKPWYKRKENFWITAGFFVAIIAISVPFFIMLLTKLGFKLESFEDLGVVGDFFGGTTVGLLSLASILFVTAAIVMQKEELELQRKEVMATRREYEITNLTMKKQQFENTFFNMVTLHHEIVNSIVYNDSYKKLQGRHAIAEIKSSLKNTYNNPSSDMLTKMNRSIVHNRYRADLAYSEFYLKYEPSLGHYFRNLYRIIKWIDESTLDFNEKKNYLGILRAQLSSSELVLIFYNNSTKNGENFKKLVDKYDFFDDHLKGYMLIRPDHLEIFN